MTPSGVALGRHYVAQASARAQNEVMIIRRMLGLMTCVVAGCGSYPCIPHFAAVACRDFAAFLTQTI